MKIIASKGDREFIAEITLREIAMLQGLRGEYSPNFKKEVGIGTEINLSSYIDIAKSVNDAKIGVVRMKAHAKEIVELIEKFDFPFVVVPD